MLAALVECCHRADDEHRDCRTSYVQVTLGTVDEGIHAMATRKTRLDAAVLDGITASGDNRKAGAAAETLQVLLATLDWRNICPGGGSIGYDAYRVRLH